jgi:hypothetical protein
MQMNIDEFWKLIGHGGGHEGRDEELKVSLQNLTPDNIVHFTRHLYRLKSKATTHKLWCAAILVGCDPSDYEFQYFLNVLVLNGKTRYHKTLRDPDSLADMTHFTNFDGEYIGMMPYVAHYLQTWKPFPERDFLEQPASVAEWEFYPKHMCEVYLPRLSTKYSNSS